MASALLFLDAKQHGAVGQLRLSPVSVQVTRAREEARDLEREGLRSDRGHPGVTQAGESVCSSRGVTEFAVTPRISQVSQNKSFAFPALIFPPVKWTFNDSLLTIRSSQEPQSTHKRHGHCFQFVFLVGLEGNPGRLSPSP